jgi:hypothetical protein
MVMPGYVENHEREHEGRFEEEGKVMYSAHGSTVSRIDGRAQLAALGDKTLYVPVTEVE